MTAPARLLSVRLQGFKSFAERTQVAFGPGISAVVGPNGSGKSNLADALRWALGEQGRALRTRKAEDVIWAGSERRPALGMADVQLVLDNADGLLPVEFGVVELGRRLFRSGENEYVLNRQRVRLRDLVDLLDAAHLAENAFLFIGQGMVDQALALRPEERRPLFEEVAGVRRHERRRRRAEEQLTEAEANLARVDDLVTELRPQVRRLAAQAEQQTSRRDAGDELAEALLTAAHARWHAAGSRLAAADAGLADQRLGVEAAMTELATREAAASGFADRLAERAVATADARRELDAARERQTAARLAAAAADGEVAAIDRERSRLTADRATLERELGTDRRRAALSAPAGDSRLEADLREAEAALAADIGELATVRSTRDATDAHQAAAQRAEASQAADLEVARRRHADLEREMVDEAARAGDAEQGRVTAIASHETATVELDGATKAATEAERIAEAARLAAEAAAAATGAASARASALTARLAAGRDRLAAALARLEADERDGLGTAARAAGGRRIADGLVVEPTLQAAVAAALGAHGAGFVVGRPAVTGLAGEHGSVLVAEAVEGVARAARGDVASLMATVRERGGESLASAIRSDPTGGARRLLARAVWLPDLAACLLVQEALPAGWIAVPRDGSAVVGETAVSLRPDQGHLARRAEAEALAREIADLEADANEAERARGGAAAEAEQAQVTASTARLAAADALDRRRAAEAAEAAAGRRAETAVREAAWLAAQFDRLRAGLERATQAVAALEAEDAAADADAVVASRSGEDGSPGRATAALERRVAELRQRRDRLDGSWREADRARREIDRERTRAEAAVAMAERRVAEIEAALAGLAGRELGAGRERTTASAELEAASAATEAATGRLDALLALDAEDRGQLGGAERAAAAAREALRSVQDAVRAAEHEELEARLGLESLREQLLVELAGLGELGLRHLGAGAVAGAAMDVAAATDVAAAAADDGDTSADVIRLEVALDAAAAQWTAEPPPPGLPTPGRLAALRRRFHELGAANPFALEEHAALAGRLVTLESQRDDLVAAVGRTRQLIAELDGLIASQFRATFGALERAFDARFRQLFGGGFARLDLTEPGDLASTGVEITARPPGKKPQALAMLSGGERALTAVALLFAMLEVRPVPFCVLDEVDAALDEANIGRFTDALRELAAETQFVVITHNRGTIETADALYGVTVGDDSVSRVISLRLEEAAAIADAAAASGSRAPIIPAGLSLTEGVAEAAGEA